MRALREGIELRTAHCRRAALGRPVVRGRSTHRRTRAVRADGVDEELGSRDVVVASRGVAHLSGDGRRRARREGSRGDARRHGARSVVVDRVVCRRRSGVRVPRRVGSAARRDRRADGAEGGHAADGDVVGRAAAGDDGGRRASRAAQRHVGTGEAGDRLVGDDGEVDRRSVGRIGLTDRLVDRHRRLGGVDCEDVGRARAGVPDGVGLRRLRRVLPVRKDRRRGRVRATARAVRERLHKRARRVRAA